MPKIVFGMIAFNADHFLRPCLRSLLPFGPVVCAEGPVAYWQKRGFTTSTDDTNKILREFNIPTVHGQWAEKDDECNAYMTLVPPDTEYIFHVDADEVWSMSVMEDIFNALDRGNIDSVGFSPYTFYGGFEHVLTGFEEEFEWIRIQRYYPGARWATHRPPTINAPDGRPWKEHCHLDNAETRKRGWRFHHFSYVFPSQVQDKIGYYTARNPDRVIPDYFNQVYLRWVLGNPMTRRIIEDEFNGVHEWRPELRSSCRTRLFMDTLPLEIRNQMPELKVRLQSEIDDYTGVGGRV
jgi:hypothetical protein